MYFEKNFKIVQCPGSLAQWVFVTFLVLALSFNSFAQERSTSLNLNEKDYFEKRGVNILVFSNWYNGLFSDSKMSGIEIIHHEKRTVTNGDVRLDNTPEQWDQIPQFVERKIDRENQLIEAFLSYPAHDFNYSVAAKPHKNGVLVSVHLESALPKELVGKAGFNLEFLPSAYFEKSYLTDGQGGVFPLYPSGPMSVNKNGETEPLPIAKGKEITLAPEDPERMISINGNGSELLLFDGRNKAQNGWFVVRSMIPANKTGTVLSWYIVANNIENWSRKPVVAHSQVGYHPSQKKVAVIELDQFATPKNTAKLYRVSESGKLVEKISAEIEEWGDYLRYRYFTFDFSSVKDEGIYVIEYGDQKTRPFRIANDIYSKTWHPTLDIFFPVQMDHMLINEAYRVWHGKSHMDDALQAPVDHVHFDLYAQGPTTDTPYKPGEHIPGLNIGGWYDAGDYDIRTQTHYATVLSLVHSVEDFQVNRDETLVDYEAGYVDLHHPDGKNDILQQIEHGTLALIAQHRAVGHAIPGIIVPDISQYTHLGDGLTMTDNLIYNPEMDSLESDGYHSGKFDDRWAFTSKSTPLNYGSIAALAAAGRALKGFNDELAEECKNTAINVWEEEHSKRPDIFQHGNTTGGSLEDEELKAAVELYLLTKEEKYAERIWEMLPVIKGKFLLHAHQIARVFPMMDKKFQKEIEKKTREYKNQIESLNTENPFSVPITRGGWAGNGTVMRFAINNYSLHRIFPEIIEKEDVFKGLNYLYGTHPGSNISFVSAVGTKSKKVAYGMNRADFSFIAGGIVPGVLILPPDYPENMEDWPFLWGENEYVINMGGIYIYLVNAANRLLEE